jgi:hypothetical protein
MDVGVRRDRVFPWHNEFWTAMSIVTLNAPCTCQHTEKERDEGMRIFLADDEASQRTILSGCLKKKRHAALEADGDGTGSAFSIRLPFDQNSVS